MNRACTRVLKPLSGFQGPETVTMRIRVNAPILQLYRASPGRHIFQKIHATRGMVQITRVTPTPWCFVGPMYHLLYRRALFPPPNIIALHNLLSPMATCWVMYGCCCLPSVWQCRNAPERCSRICTTAVPTFHVSNVGVGAGEYIRGGTVG